MIHTPYSQQSQKQTPCRKKSNVKRIEGQVVNDK